MSKFSKETSGLCNLLLKDCVHYIFASLFFKSKREHLWNLRKKSISLQKLFSFSRKSTKILKFHDVIKCLSIKKIYIILNNLGSKHSLLMKFGQFISCYKRMKIIKEFYKKWDLNTSFRHFCVCKEFNTTSIEKLNFWSKLLILDM